MSEKITRRSFITSSAAGLISAGALFSTLSFTEILAAAGKGKYKVSDDDLVFNLSDSANNSLQKVGGSVLFANDEKILIRASQTQFTALSLICTHKGCTVELSGDRFVCPCHGSEYNLKGNVLQEPAKKDLKSYDTVYDPEKNTVTVKLK